MRPSPMETAVRFSRPVALCQFQLTVGSGEHVWTGPPSRQSTVMLRACGPSSCRRVIIRLSPR
jgi:hypothetical protein